MADKEGDAVALGEQLLVKPTGLFSVIHITSYYDGGYSNLWCCYDTNPAFECTPMSTRLYTEWRIPPKCILEFRTNTFSELSKQCRPLSRCIVYAFCAPWLGWASERRGERLQDKGERDGRGWERQPPSPKYISSASSTGRFSISSAFFCTCWTDS